MSKYHCDRKFDSLQIHAEKQVLYACSKADPENIDVDWLKKNPGKLFNTPNLHRERRQMLENQRVASCEAMCFSKEDKKIWSTRLEDKGEAKKYNNVNCTPKKLDITLSGECNMSCSYCCKEFSSAWRNDIFRNGDYNKFTYNSNRYKLSSYDKSLKKVSQNKRKELEIYKLIEKEIELMLPSVEFLAISGGEPFLSENLFKTLDVAKDVPTVQVLSGLGVKHDRFKRCAEKLRDYKNVIIRISAESTKENYEFNRYGNSWANFLSNLKILDDLKINYFFNTTYCNLTVLDYINFNSEFEHIEKRFNVVYEPDFMSPHILDDETKNNLINQLNKSKFSNNYSTVELIKILNQQPQEDDRLNLSYFLKEFSQRRKLNLNFLPMSFKNWLDIH